MTLQQICDRLERLIDERDGGYVEVEGLDALKLDIEIHLRRMADADAVQHGAEKQVAA